MKKGLLIIVALGVIIAGGAWYLLSGAGDFIKQQIEKQGSLYLGTQVSVVSVDLALAQGRLTINNLAVANPAGYSRQDAFSLESITLDLGNVASEPYTVETVSLNAPDILYEVDSAGNGNLLALKDTLMKNLPKSKAEEVEQKEGANPLVIVDNVTVSKVRLKLDFEKLDTGELQIDKKVYEIELPTFNAGSIGKPNGMPADQVGAAIVSKMLDNIIAQAKSEAKKRVAEEAKKKAMEKIDKEKDKLKEKAANKLKDLFGKE